MMLAAGLGTRLRPLTAAVPKPAVPLCGVPPLRFNLALLASAGVEKVVINTHWRKEAIEDAAGDPGDLGLEIQFSHEPTILGTGGGLKNVSRFFEDETFLLVNGKNLFDADLEGAFAFHVRSRAVATMILRPYPEGASYSPIEIDSRGRIRRFATRAPREASVGEARPMTKQELSGGDSGASEQSDERVEGLIRCMFTGVHVLEPRVLDYLPPDRPVCINAHGYKSMLRAGEEVCGFLQHSGYFAEPSTPERYLAAVLDLVGGKVDLERFARGGVDPFSGSLEPIPGARVHESAVVHASAHLEPPCWVGPEARVEAEAKVGPLAVLERGVLVREGARVSRSVVWSSTEVAAGEDLLGVIASGVERVRADASPLAPITRE